MSDGLSKRLRQLDGFLMSDAVPEDSMMLSELDGYVAGVIVCPDLIMPSEWMPLIWGGEGPVFDSLEQFEEINGLIMGHYNGILRQLDRKRYAPIFDVDTRNGDTIWEIWIEGFYTALALRPDSWLSFGEGSPAHKALSVFMRLHELATTPDVTPMELDEELENLAPDLIPILVRDLHEARLAQGKNGSKPVYQNQRKTGRNDPCPCGSGKKFKNCCLK